MTHTRFYKVLCVIIRSASPPEGGGPFLLPAADETRALASIAELDKMELYSGGMGGIQTDTLIWTANVASTDYDIYAPSGLSYISPTKLRVTINPDPTYDWISIYNSAAQAPASTGSPAINGGAFNNAGWWQNADIERSLHIGPHEFGHLVETWLKLLTTETKYTNFPICSITTPSNTLAVHCAAEYGFPNTYSPDPDGSLSPAWAQVSPAWYEYFFGKYRLLDGRGMNQTAWNMEAKNSNIVVYSTPPVIPPPVIPVDPEGPPVVPGPGAATNLELQAVLDALDTTTRDAVFVNGIPVDCISWDTQHGVDQVSSTARLTLALPRHEAVTSNATIEIQAGHDDLVSTVFSGRVPAWDGAVTLRGNLLTVRAVGWSSLLNETERYDLHYPGPISLRSLFIALCQRANVPAYIAGAATWIDGSTEIKFGGNRNIDEGDAILKAGTSPLAFLNRLAEPYGYRVYDTPGGAVRLSRVSGLPPGDPEVVFSEGVNLHSFSRGHDISGKVTYPDVNGATYEDAFGAKIPIRSIAGTIPYDEDLAPEGYRYRRISNSDIVTQEAADAIRNVFEIDYSEAHTPVAWSAVALPGLSPGDVVTVNAETVEAAGTYWLMGMDLSNAGGLTGRYNGWAGAGTPLASAVDRIEIPIQTTPIHLGDETLSHYAVPAPLAPVYVAGKPVYSKSWTFYVPERATAVNIRGLAHGVNSQLSGGANTDLEVSRFELHRAGVEKAESSGNMPVMNEDLKLKKDYTKLSNWSPFAVNLRGTDVGAVTLKIIAGVKFGVDDFEIRDVYAECFGTVEPIITPRESEVLV